MNSTTSPDPDRPPWSTAQKVAFRLLFVVGGGLLLLSVYGNLGLGVLWNITGIWWVLAQVGSHLVRGEGVSVVAASAGDQLWAWCMHLGWIVVGVVIVAIWSAVDRNRATYRSLLGLLAVFARVALALSMVVYGLAKTIPTQMGFMTTPAHQLQLVGDTSMFNTLWGFMGASTPYSVVTGVVELTAGVLLLWRRTSVLGGFLAIVAMGQVAVLNLFYDVPVKLVSIELFLIAVALTVRYWRPLLRVALGLAVDQRVTPLDVAGPHWLRIIGACVKYLALTLVVATTAIQGALMLYVIHTPRSPLDGVWRATSFTVDGAPAGLTDRDPAPWANLAITLRGNTDNAVLESVSTTLDSVVTQDPSGYTVAWSAAQKGDVLELTKTSTSTPLPVSARVDGDRLLISATVDGKRFDGVYERRFMERERSHFRWVHPDGPAEAGAGPGG